VPNNLLQLVAFPNPSGDNGFEIAIEGLSDEQTANDVTITIYDIYGKKVYAGQFNGQSNGAVTKINSDGTLSKGIYMINAVVNGESINQKIIIK
jgi:flagellar hook assembly protein FlgD